MKKRSYPSIELPRILNKELIDTPTPNRIPLPIEPEKPKLRKPTPKSDKPWYKRIILMFFLMIIIPYTIFAIWATPSFTQEQQEKFWLLEFLLICAILWAIFDLVFTDRKNKKRIAYDEITTAYQKDLEKYEIDIENYYYNEWLWRMKENPEGEEALEEKLNFIVKRLEQSPKLKNTNYSNNKLAINYFLDQVKIYDSEIEKGFHSTTYQYKDGYQFFKYNSGIFYTNKAFIDFENNEIYDTDLIYWIPEINLFINIEIDEPYDLESKYPKHSLVDIDVYGKKSKELISLDDTRDKFFRDNNWIVIRFAEEQIIKSPRKCHESIIWVASFFSSPLYNFKDFHYYLNWNIDPINKWLKEEANDMASIDYRKSYLNDHFKLS